MLLLAGVLESPVASDSLNGEALRSSYIGGERGTWQPSITLMKKKFWSSELQPSILPANVSNSNDRYMFGNPLGWPGVATAYYYSVGPDDGRHKVSFSGSNLAERMQSVPEACSKMKTYKVCKLTSATLSITGAALVVGSLVAAIQGADEQGIEVPPGFWVGTGMALSACVPKFLAGRTLKKAVWRYNVGIISQRTHG